ncbi:hypothetical protein F5B22DRAFT_649644 [Xylaria bambusicola]|uniref:uncharacterized protein n=1 Tax=Xylaria bambusicola TaxID=326684 RepID=UPI002007D3CB|nr:uncharacterized protein F5B22DRAFT_649644 [Xylaria bambusicola]KAI0508748.1 hypothetical protein F5B22DRAFT_649644 [Xylaria bambusicola]
MALRHSQHPNPVPNEDDSVGQPSSSARPSQLDTIKKNFHGLFNGIHQGREYDKRAGPRDSVGGSANSFNKPTNDDANPPENIIQLLNNNEGNVKDDIYKSPEFQAMEAYYKELDQSWESGQHEAERHRQLMDMRLPIPETIKSGDFPDFPATPCHILIMPLEKVNKLLKLLEQPTREDVEMARKQLAFTLGSHDALEALNSYDQFDVLKARLRSIEDAGKNPV